METLRYHSIEELRGLSLSELHALWELVPTDRQRAYKAAYEREVRTAGAVGSDELERQVAVELLKRYDEAALVPVGSRWARSPGRVQDAAKQNVVLDAPEDEVKPASGKPSPKVMLAVGLAALVFFGLMFTRLLGGRSSGNVEVTPEVSLTPTPLVSPTPTPLALEAQDDVIQGGDSGREVAYPVNLQVILPNGDAPRVWVVQRRRVQASEWRFDLNPDTASFINGMSVRPVIGIPWSEENAAFFADIGTETSFLLTMNTGAVLRFEFDDRREVRRSETNIFRQVSRGLVLLLIGETDADGLPTATRTLVTATYPPEQELSRDGQVIGMDITLEEGSVGEALALGDASITLQDARLLSDQPDLPANTQYLLLNMEVTAGAEALDTTTWRVEFVDAGGQVYTPSSATLTYTDYDALPVEIPALSSQSASIGYIVPDTLQNGHWIITDTAGNGVSFVLSFATAPLDLRYDGVDVRLVSVTYLEGQITTHLRIYNGRAETLHFTQDDIWLALGYAPEPPGPRNPAEGLTPFDLLPEQAVDLRLVWYWGGEPYASMGVGDYRFAIQLRR
ncbi:MAG TPA: hypothetical protein PLQ56_19840 [Aggregatilineales bacterium]|nr:hypothetical protein [Aggregatilineales bacterium]